MSVYYNDRYGQKRPVTLLVESVFSVLEVGERRSENDWFGMSAFVQNLAPLGIVWSTAQRAHSHPAYISSSIISVVAFAYG